MPATKDPRSEFINELNKKGKELEEVAQQEVGGGFMEDSEIIETLQLDPDTKKQFQTRVSRVRYGRDKNKNLYVAFNYSVADGPHQGITVSDFVGLGGRSKDDRTKRYKKLCGILQRLNFDTTKWKQADLAKNIVDACDKLNGMNPRQGVRLSLSTWGDENDRINFDIVGLYDAAPSENGHAAPAVVSASSDAPQGESYADIGAAADEAGDAEHPTLEAKAEEYEITVSDDDSWAELGAKIDEAEAAASDAVDAFELPEGFDGNDYVDYECKYNDGENEIKVSATAWDESTELFTVEDDNGESYDTSFDTLDFGEGYGVAS